MIVRCDSVGRVRPGSFEGKDGLRSLVFSDGEVVFGEPIDDRLAAFVQHCHVEKDQAGGHMDHRLRGRHRFVLGGCLLWKSAYQEERHVKECWKVSHGQPSLKVYSLWGKHFSPYGVSQ